MEKKTKSDIEQFFETINTPSKILGEFIKVDHQLRNIIGETIEELSSPLIDIDWDETMRTWRGAAEKLGRKGWTFPLSMSPREVVEFSEIKDLDKAMEEYFSSNDHNKFKKLKKAMLNHELLVNWRDLLEQCFNNYENGNYLVTIPNLFIIVEGLARTLISQKFEKYKTDNRTSLREQYRKVRKDVSREDPTKDKIYLIAYVSVLEFLRQVFRAGNFDENPTRFPIINRDWVLHGKDTPVNWKKVDALRLFNAIYSLTAVDFLLEESI